jgi:hypothetical protein
VGIKVNEVGLQKDKNISAALRNFINLIQHEKDPAYH